MHPWHQVDRQHRGCPAGEKEEEEGYTEAKEGVRPKGRAPSGATYSRTSSASGARGTGLTTSTLRTFTATSTLGTGFTLGRKRREEEP